MAFLKCVSAYGAEGVPGQYLERNLLCDTIADVNGLFNADNLVKSNLNGTCPSVCVGDVFNVFVKNRDNDTFRLTDNKFRPELIDNWEPTNMRLTCVYVERDEYSDKLNYALFIPHSKSKIIQPLVISGDKTGTLAYNNSLFSHVYVVNVGARTGGAETVTVNDAVFDFKNLDKFKYIICSVTQKADKSLAVSKSNNASDVLFCAVVDTDLNDIPPKGNVVSYDIVGNISQPDDFLVVFPFKISPKGVFVDIYVYDETAVFDEKPVFQLLKTDGDKNVICDDVLARKFKPITVDTEGHSVAFVMKTKSDTNTAATVRVFLYT